MSKARISFGTRTARVEDPALLTGKGALHRRHRPAGNAVGGVRALAACSCGRQSHRHAGGTRDARRACGFHARRSDAPPELGANTARPVGAGDRRARQPQPQGEHHPIRAGARRGLLRRRSDRGSGCGEPPDRRGRGAMRRDRVRAAAGGGGHARRDCARRAAGAPAGGGQHPGGIHDFLRRLRACVRGRSPPARAVAVPAPRLRPSDGRPWRACQPRSAGAADHGVDLDAEPA